MNGPMNSLGQKVIVVLLALSLHAVALFGMWRARPISPPADVAPLFVNFIAAPPPAALPGAPRPTAKPLVKPQARPQPLPPKQQLQQKPVASPMPAAHVLAAQAPGAAPGIAVGPALMTEAPASPSPPSAGPAVPALAGVGAQMPAGPVALSSELSLACPQRTAPTYPALSRRLNEQGVVVLQVTLSEDGAVAEAQVQSSSGFARLDDAALTAVRSWHCTAPTRIGQPVRATALQPFHFVLREN